MISTFDFKEYISKICSKQLDSMNYELMNDILVLSQNSITIDIFFFLQQQLCPIIIHMKFNTFSLNWKFLIPIEKIFGYRKTLNSEGNLVCCWYISDHFCIIYSAHCIGDKVNLVEKIKMFPRNGSWNQNTRNPVHEKKHQSFT